MFEVESESVYFASMFDLCVQFMGVLLIKDRNRKDKACPLIYSPRRTTLSQQQDQNKKPAQGRNLFKKSKIIVGVNSCKNGTRTSSVRYLITIFLELNNGRIRICTCSQFDILLFLVVTTSENQNFKAMHSQIFTWFGCICMGNTVRYKTNVPFIQNRQKR